MCCAASSGIVVRGSARQYISDGNIHPGADAHLCPESSRNFPCTDPYGTLDHEQYGGVYDTALDKFWYLYQIEV